MVTIADQGVGIAEEELETIFDKFVQSAPHEDRGRRHGPGYHLPGDHDGAPRPGLGADRPGGPVLTVGAAARRPGAPGRVARGRECGAAILVYA